MYFFLNGREKWEEPTLYVPSENDDSKQYEIMDTDGKFSDQVKILRGQADLIFPTADNREIGAVFDAELTEEIAKQNASLVDFGYLSYEDRPTRFEYIMQKIEGGQSGVYPLAFYGGTSNIPLPFFPTFPDKEFISSDTESFLIPSGASDVKQIHTHTKFGNLIIDESRNTSMSLDNPNVEVAGQDSTLLYIKHQDERWATKLYVPLDKGKLFVIESDKKVEGEARNAFLYMAERLVANQTNY